LITLTAHALNQEKQPRLSDRYIHLYDFRRHINEILTLNVSLQTEEDTEAAVKFFNDTIQWGRWKATLEYKDIRLTNIN
jgi:hypothetical protein